MSEDIDFGNLAHGSGQWWRMGNTKFMAVKLEQSVKSSIDASGAVKITGITGDAAKDKQVANFWLVFVMEGGKVTTFEAWQLEKMAQRIAMSSGAPADVIFKDARNPEESSS